MTGPLTITQSARIEPGQYHVDVQDGQAVIEIGADNVVLEMTGVTLESTARRPWERVGIGIHAKGRSHVSVFGGAIRGYRINVFLEGEAGSGSGMQVVATDVSGSRAQRLLSTDTHFEAQDWVNIFDLDYVAFNDGSDSPHNSFEAVFTDGNEFYHNLADHSDYGFWLSFSRHSAVIDKIIPLRTIRSA